MRNFGTLACKIRLFRVPESIPNVIVCRLWQICGEDNLRGYYDILKALFKYSLCQS